jgi:two-component system nitrate/nitrite response regulator NarL
VTAALTGPVAAVPSPCTRAMIIDDHQLLAQSIGLALGMEGLVCHVPVVVDVTSLLVEVSGWRPDLVLLDLDLGLVDGDGTDLVAPLVQLGCRVLVVSAATEPDVLARTLERGAVGIVDKRLPFDRLLGAVLLVARGEELPGAAEREELIATGRRDRSARERHLAPFARLTGSEAEVLRALAVGDSVAAIARGRWVSEATVRSQVRAVLAKLGVSSQLEAVALVHRVGWV